jgi:hypothetical protein
LGLIGGLIMTYNTFRFGLMFGLAAGGVMGAAGMHYYSQNVYTPSGVYVIDVNGDKKPDVVVKNKNGADYVFIRQNGNYKPLDKVLEQQRATGLSQLEAKLNTDKKSIEANTKTLK